MLRRWILRSFFGGEGIQLIPAVKKVTDLTFQKYSDFKTLSLTDIHSHNVILCVKPSEVKTLQKGSYQGQSVLYWMNRDKRVKDNWALLEAQNLAMRKKAPLIVCFQYFGKFKEANIRQYSFLVKGLLELSNI